MTARPDDPAGRPRAGRRPGAPAPPPAGVPLLADLLGGKLLDPGYAEAAARRAAAGGTGPRRGRLRGTGVLLVLVLAGTLIAVAGAQVRRGEPVAARQRSRLIGEIRARTAESDRLQHRVDRLRARTERTRAAALARSDEGRRVRQRLARDGAAAAAAPARGAGIVVTLADAPRTGRTGGRVYDQDLQILVNGLWAAGAEAIGVNGQRLTPTTAIRAAGEAILVDYRPLTGPYEVTALGDPDGLRDAFARSAADRRLAALHDRFGIRFEVRRSSGMRLPAAGTVRLRYAGPRRKDGQ